MVSIHDNRQWTVYPGDTVYTTDGYRLGEVVQVTDGELLVQSGFFFRRRYVLSRGEILRSSEGTVLTSLTFDAAKARERR